MSSFSTTNEGCEPLRYDSAVRSEVARSEPRHGEVVFRRIFAICVIAILLGVMTALSPAVAFGFVLLVALCWLAFRRPAVAFVAVTVLMVFPYTWTPSAGGHLLVPSMDGGLVFVLVGLICGRRLKFNVVDWIVLGYIAISVLTAIVNGDRLTFMTVTLKTVLVPYVGWRLLLANVSQVRAVLAPCLIVVGTGVAAVAIFEWLHGEALFIHSLVNPVLVTFAHTYIRAGHVRATATFGQPIALGMFLLVPIGLAFSGRTRLRFIALGVLLTAELFTYSRGPWIGAVVLSLLLVPLVVRRARPGALMGGLVLLIAAGVVFAGPVGQVLSKTSQQGSSENRSSEERVSLFQTSIDKANLLGYSTDSGTSVYEEEGIKDVASFYALTLGEKGLVGLLPLLMLFGVALNALRRGYQYGSRVLVIWAAIVLAQMVALTTAPPITNYGPFLWLTVACLATYFRFSVPHPDDLVNLGQVQRRDLESYTH